MRGDVVQATMIKWRVDNLSSWEGEGEPYFLGAQEPIGILGDGPLEPYEHRMDDGRERNTYISSLRKNRWSAIADPVHYPYYEDNAAYPLANWVNPDVTPENWEDIKDWHETDQYALRVDSPALSSLSAEMRKYLAADEETVIVSPFTVTDLMEDKHATATFLDSYDLPYISTCSVGDLVHTPEKAKEVVGDGPVVVKPPDGSNGDDVEEQESVEEITPGAYPLDTVIQPKIPHDHDYRLIVVGDRVVNAEKRVAGDDFRTNLALVEETVDEYDCGYLGEAYNAMEQERVEPIDVDLYDRVPVTVAEQHDAVLSPGLSALIDDVVDALDTFSQDVPDTETPPFFFGLDVLEVPPDRVEELPDAVQDTVGAYHDGDGVYLITEFNQDPGTIVDLLAQWEGRPEQNSYVHALNLLRELTDCEPVALGDMRDPDAELYHRTETYFPTMGPDYRDDIIAMFSED